MNITGPFGDIVWCHMCQRYHAPPMCTTAPAYTYNIPQVTITPAEGDVATELAKLRAEVKALREEVARLRRSL